MSHAAHEFASLCRRGVLEFRREDTRSLRPEVVRFEGSLVLGRRW